jgi:hypothetical protein
MADAQWMKTCELLRKAAANVGPLGEGRSYVESGWKGGYVADLPLNLPVNPASGNSDGLETNQLTRNDNFPTPPVNSPPIATSARPNIPTGSAQASSSATPTLKSAPNSSTNYLDQVAQELRSSMALPDATKVDNKGTMQRQKDPDTKRNDLKRPEELANIRTEAIPEVSKKEIKTTQPDEASSPKAPLSNHTATMTNSTRTTNTSAKDTATISSSGSKASIEEKPTQVSLPPPPEEAAVFEPRHTLARTPLNAGSKEKEEEKKPPKDSIAIPTPVAEGQNPAAMKDSEPVTTYFPVPNKETLNKTEPHAAFAGPKQPVRSNSSYPQVTTSQPPPTLPHAPASYAGRPVGRTMSIDSTTSNGSHVAAMRDRYNTGSPPLANPHANTRPGEIYVPRDRESGRVSDIASRFTPIDGPPRISPTLPRENRAPRNSYAPQSPSARWATDAPVADTLPIRTPIPREPVDEFGSSLSSMQTMARDTMPNPDRRHQPMSGLRSQTLGPASTLPTPYDLQLSELELQQREMELQIHRQRLQLAKDREAIISRERERAFQEEADNSDYASGRETRGHARYKRNMDANRDGYLGDPYDRESPREAYDAPNRDPYNVANRYGYERDRGRYEPNIGSQPPIEAIGLSSYRNRAYTADSRPSDSPQRSYTDLSSGLGVLGLGLPPGAGPSARLGTPSKESLPLAAQSTQNLTTPSMPNPEGSSATKAPSSRRSAEVVSPATGTTGNKGNEKDKGGTWIGRGLKRFSMPLGAGPNS